MQRYSFTQNKESLYFIEPSFQINNVLYFLQFLNQISHEESENHGRPEALGIIIRAILAFFLIKSEEKG